MRKIVLRLTTGMVAACALTMLTAVNAENKMAMEDFSDLELEFTEDDSNLDLPLPTPQASQSAGQKVISEPVKDLDLAQTPAPPAPITEATGAVDANVSNILAEPALNPPAVNAPVKTVEPTLPQLPPARQSIVNPADTVETLPPAVTIDPTMDMGTSFSQPLGQPLPGNTMVARGPAPVVTGGGCPNCPQGGYGVGYGGYGGYTGYAAGGTLRPVYYGVQRNGLPAYPRAGNCCGGCCGCGHRYPMEYPYYTLRGPRDFDDPNPRTIGP